MRSESALCIYIYVICNAGGGVLEKDKTENGVKGGGKVKLYRSIINGLLYMNKYTSIGVVRTLFEEERGEGEKNILSSFKRLLIIYSHYGLDSVFIPCPPPPIYRISYCIRSSSLER